MAIHSLSQGTARRKRKSDSGKACKKQDKRVFREIPKRKTDRKNRRKTPMAALWG
jgi:hypothetical protein